MFFRGFREEKADQCRLEFHSKVIEKVVKYCYSGEVESDDSIAASCEERAQFLVELREAGRYFELEEVKVFAERRIGNCVFADKSRRSKIVTQYACAFLNELFKHGEDDSPLWSALLEFAVENPKCCFGTCHPNAFVLIKVLEKISDTFIVVKCLQAWIFHEIESEDGDDDEKVGDSSDEQKQALVDFAKSVDLKELSAEQLSLLFRKRSFALFSSKRVLEAVFHQVQGQEIQSSRSRPKATKRFYVSGAGWDDLNGFYSQMNRGDKKVNMFSKYGDISGHDCLFIIHCNHTEMKWLLSITKTGDSLMLDDNQDVQQDKIHLHAYKAEEEDEEEVPFNSWRCLEGAGPAPIVARIDGQS